MRIPVIAAGGVFSGADGMALIEAGCAGVQVATRFTVTPECGLPAEVKQVYLRAEPDDVVVNGISPTGYPMRMLRQSPAIGSRVRPNCEAYGYLLDKRSRCPYLDWYRESGRAGAAAGEKVCLCTEMRRYRVWTCGHLVWRLKETADRLPDGDYALPSTEHVYRDYQFSSDGRVHPPGALPPAGD